MTSLSIDLTDGKTSLAEAAKGVTPHSLQSLSILVEASNLYNPMELANWVPLLTPNAHIEIKVNGEGDLKPIHTSFLLAGLKASSERVGQAGLRILVAERKAKTSTQSKPIQIAKPQSITNDDNLLDEDDLLADELEAPSMTPRQVNGDDCAGRKPCDDCTCGRSERESASEEKKEQTPINTSNCGNCAKGDAFRCAGCPYLGKPAFKAGEEHLVLDLTDDF